MKRLALGLLLAVTACGDNLPGGPGGSGSDGGDDGGVTAKNLTTFVVDLIKNHTDDQAPPVAFDEFSTLSDPDLNDIDPKTGGYATLFQ